MKKPVWELVGGAEVKPSPHWRMPPHLHASHHELILVLSGSMLLKTHHGEFMATAGDALFYEEGLIHEEISQSHDPVNTYFIAFRAGKLLPQLPLRFVDTEGRLRQLLSWIIRDRQLGRSEEKYEGFLRAVMGELEWLCAHPPDPWLQLLLKFMSRSFAQPLTLDDLAEQARMSRYAFIRKFKRQFGKTPMEHLRLLRLNEARNLILGSGLPLKSIAPQVGLGDEYQLSKLFRRYFGVSPREMRTRPSGKSILT